MFKTVLVGAVAVSALKSAADHDAERAAMIEAINNDPTSTWKAGFNTRFQGTPVGSASSLCGVPLDQLERTKAKIAAGKIGRAEEPELFSAPEDFDSAANWPECADVITDIRDQSNCGCCWAFGGASAASDRLCIASKASVKAPISAEDVCFGASYDGCGGGYLDDTWEYVQDGAVTGGNQGDTGPLGGGFCSAFSLPHCHHHGPQGDDPYPAEGEPGCPSESSPNAPKKCDAGAKAPYDNFASSKYSFSGMINSLSSEAQIQKSIMAAGPVESAFTVYGDFENYVSGVYKKSSFKVLGGHAIRIVGWGVDNGTKYWKVANSWNPFWGEKGYFRIVRGDSEGNGGIENSVVASSADSQWGKKSALDGK